MKKILFVAMVFLVIGLNMDIAKSALSQENYTPKPFEYTARKGDNLTKIARTFKVDRKALVAENKSAKCLKSENLVLAGCKLRVPGLYPEKEVKQSLATSEMQSAIKLDNAGKNLSRSSEYGAFWKKSAVIIGVVAMVLVLMLILSQLGSNKTWEEVHDLQLKLGEKDTEIEESKKASAELRKTSNESMERLHTTQAQLEEKKSQLLLARTAEDSLRSELYEFQKVSREAGFAFISRENKIFPSEYTIEETHIEMGRPIVKKIKCVKCEATDVKPENSNMSAHYWKHIESMKESINHATSF